MKQTGRLHKVLKNMLKLDTGTNVHVIRVYNTSIHAIYAQLDIVDRDNNPARKGRKFDIRNEGEGTFIIQIYRPIEKPKNRWLL